MTYRVCSLVFFACTGIALVSSAGGPLPSKDLIPQPIKLAPGAIDWKDLLAAIEKQSGNVVSDRRASREAIQVKLLEPAGHFWPLMDAIGKQTGVGFSCYQPDGGVAFVDVPYRALKTHYSGLFRFAVKRMGIHRDDETQTHTCDVTLDVAWEPRFQPLFLHLERATVTFAPDAKQKALTQQLERQTAHSVSGAGATEVKLSMAAPERTSPQIASLTGVVNVIGPPKMLDFAFDKLAAIKKGAAPRRAEPQDGVRVSLTYLETAKERWTVDVEIENPPGAIVPLESFQAESWLDNNRVWLVWTDARTRKVNKLEASGFNQQNSKVGTKLQYYFTPTAQLPLPPAGVDCALRYRTPNRVVAISVPFAFRDLPLP